MGNFHLCYRIKKYNNHTLTASHPKLPMRDKGATKKYYVDKLGFQCEDN
jgi:hypothetical protein